MVFTFTNMKNLFFISVCTVCLTAVTAIKCYICSSDLHGSSCADPLDTSNISWMKCEDVYRYQRITDGSSQSDVETFNAKTPYMSQTWDPNFSYNWNGYSNELRCVQYEKIHFRTNKREFVRMCQGRNQPNLCTRLQEEAQRFGYSLGKCDVCSSDYCNASIKIKISLILNFIFFIVFYFSTN